MTKVLIIEDTAFFQTMYGNALKEAGFDVDIASDGEEGLELIKKNKPRLVFMDIVMPKLNGTDTLVKIKNDPEIKNTPVVMLTSMSAEAPGEDSLLKGASAYLIKNESSPQSIVDTAKQMLGTSQAPLDPRESK